MRRLCSALAIALAAFALHAGPASAQTYPSKPVRIVVPFVAGGAVDTLARMMGAKLSESLGQPIIVENRPGAGGNVAADAVAKSPPDGYTILQNTNGAAIAPALYNSLPFDAVNDFAPVTQIVASNLILVASPKSGITSVGQLIARAGVQVDRVEHRAPDVVLALVPGAVPDPHRPRVVVAGQVVEHLLLEPALAADPVHDLQRALLGLDL